MKNGPILLIEDDIDDQEFIIDALQTLGVPNEVITFDNGQKALDFLRITPNQSFVIISDVNLPIMNGLQFKSEIEKDEYLRSKSIPFIFLTTSADSKAVKEAFDLGAQGFFVKENTSHGICTQLKGIVEYWKSSRHPNYREA